MKINKNRVLNFFKRYVIGLFVFCIVLISLDFYIEELANEETKIEKFPNITLLTSSEKTISIEDFKGKVVLVDFWFSKCKPCIQEMKYFSNLLEKYENELAIISFSSDSQNHTQEILQSNDEKWNFLDRNNPNWVFCNSNPENKQSLIKLFNIEYYPTYFLFDENGILISKPKSGIYGIEKELNGTFSISITLKKYLNTFETFKLYISIAIYSLIVILILITQLIICIFKKYNKNS
jgi:thiol-disulfide isomerase/thioredoxin